MRKWLFILTLFLVPTFAAFSQTDDSEQEGGKIQVRMQEYIQKKLGLSKNESAKFSPVFLRYFRDFVQTHRENKQDRLILQQKIIDLRLRYRAEFKQILGEDRANKVYRFEDQFRREAIQIIKENRRDRTLPRRTKSILLQ